MELVGENTVHLDNELKKIALAHGTGEGVGEREVRALVARTSEVKPWDFTAAFAERNLGKCLALRSKMESTSPHVLIALCTTRLRELMAAQSMARRGNPARSRQGPRRARLAREEPRARGRANGVPRSCAERSPLLATPSRP